MQSSLKGKTALITGVSRGIGKGIMEHFISLGINVLGVSRDIRSIEDSYNNDNLLLLPCDITSENDIDSVIKETIDRFGKIDFLINNAGITKDNLLIKMNNDEWNSVMDTNLRASFMLTKKVLKGMIRNRFGRIINISSVIAITGNPGQSNYSAAKSGLIGFTKSIAQEVGSRNITANAIAPGYIETAMTESLSEKIKNEMLNNIPLKKFGTIENVSDLVCFLVSDNASYITGQTINVDGGMVMQ
tara:strand:- start:368 stop:1102 length:735 start_codon:yes stop_codon:yes gene_type:complete